MEKEDILAISRRENKNRDLAEAEMSAQAGSIASRIGAGTCCFVSVLFVWAANTMLFSPWIIYFSILGTHYLVRFIKAKRKTDLTITVLYFAMFILAEMVGVSRNTISSIETGQFNPTAKLALILCIALDKKFEELFYF